MYLIYARIKYIVYVRALSVHIYAHSVDTHIRAFSGYIYTRIKWIHFSIFYHFIKLPFT